MTGKRWKQTALVIVAAAAIGAAVWGVVWAAGIDDPAMPTDVHQADALLASDGFDGLSETRRYDYAKAAMKAARDAKDTDPEAAKSVYRGLRERAKEDPAVERAMSDTMEAFMLERAAWFADLPDDQQRAMLQQIGHGMYAWQQNQKRRDTAPTTPEQQAEAAERKREIDEKMGERMSKGNPQAGGLMGEFFKALQREREKAGLPPLEIPRFDGRRD